MRIKSENKKAAGLRLRDISDIGLVLEQSKVAGIFGFFDAHES